jgi:hypothetical protein
VTAAVEEKRGERRSGVSIQTGLDQFGDFHRRRGRIRTLKPGSQECGTPVHHTDQDGNDADQE